MRVLASAISYTIKPAGYKYEHIHVKSSYVVSVPVSFKYFNAIWVKERTFALLMVGKVYNIQSNRIRKFRTPLRYDLPELIATCLYFIYVGCSGQSDCRWNGN